jgi:ParB family chromosome partitioning protein
MKQAQKEKEKRQTSISDIELKRISSIAKTEQALNLLENNFDILKSNKSVIRNDADLKVRVQILKDRMSDLLDNL